MGSAELESPSPNRKLQEAEPDFLDGLDLYAQHSLEPSGGDFFDTLRIGTRMAFLLGDVAGRRPEVDPIVEEMRRAFRETSEALFSAHEVNLMEAAETLILAINQALIGKAKQVRFAPTMVGCYDVQTGVLAYINAGGQTALIQDSEGSRALPNVSVPLGLFTHLPYDASIQAFEPGAMLLVVTKGVTGSMGSKTPFGEERVIEAMQRSNDGPASEVCRAVLDAAHRFEKGGTGWWPFRGKQVREDMTALAMVRAL